MNISYSLAEFIAGTRYEDIPPSVIENQKKSILDAVGITLGASTLGDGCTEMVALAEELAANGDGEATVIGFSKRLPAAWAAFANASMAHSLDFGDTHMDSTIHPNSSSFPSALALAEKLGNVSGKRLLTALVLGSETAIRIALAADVNTLDYGFYVPTIYSSYGAVAACAKLLDLSPDQIVSAFSFNLCQTTCSSELVNNQKTVVRSVREAFAARNAITACMMAKKNLLGFDAPLEGKCGFYHTLLRDAFTARRVTDGLGVNWEAERLTYKLWPCCFGNHSPMTAAIQLSKEHKIRPDEIENITVKVGAQNIGLCEPLEERRNPESAIIGKFSIPYNVASAVLYGGVDIDSFSPERLHDAKIRALTAKVNYIYCDQWQRGKETWSEVTIDTPRGSFTKFVKVPFGTPENPMEESAFLQKFRSCASKASVPLTAERIVEIENTVRCFETLPDINLFTDLFMQNN